MAELLDEQALHKLSKDDLIKYALKVSNISSKVDELTEALADIKTRLEVAESHIKIVQTVNANLQAAVTHLRGKQVNTERIQTNNSQYLRNRQVEIKGVPTDISQENLKPEISKLLSLTGVDIKATDIGKCHRLNNENNVIIEFCDRDTRDSMLRARKNLKGKGENLIKMNMEKVMILESLCPDYACLDFICRKLAKKGELNQTWFFNGRLWVKTSADSQKINISHITELYTMYGDQVVDDILDQSSRWDLIIRLFFFYKNHPVILLQAIPTAHLPLPIVLHI